MAKITVIGTGGVGACIAFELAHRALCRELVLIDIVTNLAEGNAMDISHATQAVQVKAGSYKDMADSDIVIVTAGRPRSPDMKSRLELASFNAGIIKNIAEEIRQYAPKSIVITLTNPVDTMNYMMYRHTGFERSRVIGFSGELDSARFRTIIAPNKPQDIEAYVMGEHGDSQVPVFSRLRQKEKFLILSKEEKEELIKKCRNSSTEVISRKGATVFAPAHHTISMVEAILWDKMKLMMCSAVLDGEYGQSGLSIGVPCIIGKKGILKVEEWKLPQDEQKMFIDSVLNLKSSIRELFR